MRRNKLQEKNKKAKLLRKRKEKVNRKKRT